MIPAAFEYTRARSLTQALKALSQENTKAIAGGQTLIPLLRFRLAQPARLIDISGLRQLQGIKRGKEGLRIGAATTYRDLLDSPVIRRQAPLIAEVTEHIGDRQVRNLGTLGGSLAHGDPASDMPAVMLALDASFVLASQSGTRTVPAGEFFLGALLTALQPGELLTEIAIPPLPRGAGTAYASFEQPASGYALAGAAAVVAREQGTVSHATLALTGVGDHPFRAHVATLLGTRGDAEAIRAAAEGVGDGIEPLADIHAPAEYRRHLARVAARRALARALERAK